MSHQFQRQLLSLVEWVHGLVIQSDKSESQPVELQLFYGPKMASYKSQAANGGNSRMFVQQAAVDGAKEFLRVTD